MSKVQKIKTHIKENKKTYIVGGVCLVVTIAGITACIMRDRYAVLQTGADGPDVATVRSLSFNFLSKESGNVTTVISREGKGHPGYITRWLEEMIDYETQGLAATEHDIKPSVMSAHIQGRIPDIDGKHFVRVSV